MSFKLTKPIWLIVLGLFFILVLVALSIGPKKQISLPQDLDLKKTQEPYSPSVVRKTIPVLGHKLPIAIVVDNFNKSRPLAGINQAVVIYEAPVEADITRLTVIFDQDFLPDKIGPVRSARPYLADWAEEYGALFIHAGGSPEFLKKMNRGNYQITNLDEISQDGTYFWRDWQRQKPHNLYISEHSILQVIENKKLANILKPDFIKWPRTKESLVQDKKIKDSLPETDNGVTNPIIKINYREPVIWQFDKDLQVYLRFQDGEMFVDENGEQVQTNNLIIQKTDIVVLDEIGRRFIKTTGQGQSFIFQKGFLIQGSWQKSKNSQQTRFYDVQGREIEFLPGLIWIEIVSDNHQVLY